MSDKKLKPCPFCGNVAVINFDSTLSHLGKTEWFAKCRNCTATGGIALSKNVAITMWNRRVGEEAQND